MSRRLAPRRRELRHAAQTTLDGGQAAAYPRAVLKLVVNGAKLKCDQGMAPGSLTVLPVVTSSASDQPTATVADHIAMVNIAPFGMCKTQANPQVAAATAAAMGTLTPMPCLPIVSAPWSPGSSVSFIDDKAALTSDSKCTCQWTGSIEITDPGSDIDVT